MAKLRREQKQSKNTGVEIMGRIMEYTLAIVLLALCIALPLYAKEGYYQIGDVKFTVYKTILTRGFAVLLVMTVLYLGFWLKSDRKWRVSITDVMVVLYLISCGISALTGGFFETARWGSSGWHMGLMSQLGFVLLYLFLSRFGRYYKVVLAVLCAVATVVFAIGVLHRLLIDPIGFYEGLNYSQKAQYLSTLGQATWYASFLAVMLPVCAAVFLYAKQRALRVTGGISMFVGLCSLVTQNSDSAYFAFAGFMLVFFWVSVENEDTFQRFMWIVTCFFGAGKLMYFLLKINPNPELEFDVVTEFVLCSGAAWALLAVSLCINVLLFIRRNKPYSIKLMEKVRKWVVIAVGVCAAGSILLIVLQAKRLLPAAVSEKLEQISYFNWGDAWGNGRGRIWTFALKVYGEADLPRKLFGVGPDCLNSYIEAYYSEEVRLLWGDLVLTNAHNEWLNILISDGLFGFVSYIGIFVTALYRFLKVKPRNLVMTAVAAAAVSYMAYDFFCYQEVLCTPFIFILLGIGENVWRGVNGNTK
jgi:O-antigen ligase